MNNLFYNKNPPRMPSSLSYPILEDYKDIKTDKTLKNLIPFENIKRIAVYHLGLQVLTGVQIAYNLPELCPRSNDITQMSHEMFSWNLNDCMVRRTKNMSWHSVMTKVLSEKCLEKQKTKVDCEELLKHLILVFELYLQQNTEFELHRYLQDCLSYSNLEAIFTNALQENQTALNNAVNHNFAMQFVRKSMLYSKKLKRNTVGFFVQKQQELRYEVAFTNSINEQSLLASELLEKSLEDKIKETEDRILKEKYAAQCSMNMYYIQIESLKDKLNIMEADFKEKNEEADHALLETRKLIDRITYQKHHFLEQLDRFRESIQEMNDNEPKRKRKKFHFERGSGRNSNRASSSASAGFMKKMFARRGSDQSVVSKKLLALKGSDISLANKNADIESVWDDNDSSSVNDFEEMLMKLYPNIMKTYITKLSRDGVDLNKSEDSIVSEKRKKYAYSYGNTSLTSPV